MALDADVAAINGRFLNGRFLPGMNSIGIAKASSPSGDSLTGTNGIPGA
jgi:hypothetical protein